MEKMTREEMIEFLKGIDCRKNLLDEEKRRIRGSVETLQEAIYRNNFARHDDGSGVITAGFSPDKVFRVLMNSERDIEVEARNMASQMIDVYKREDQLVYDEGEQYIRTKFTDYDIIRVDVILNAGGYEKELSAEVKR